MFIVRATYEGPVYVHEINSTRATRWRYRGGVAVIDFDKRAATAAAKVLRNTKPDQRNDRKRGEQDAGLRRHGK